MPVFYLQFCTIHSKCTLLGYVRFVQRCYVKCTSSLEKFYDSSMQISVSVHSVINTKTHLLKIISPQRRLDIQSIHIQVYSSSSGGHDCPRAFCILATVKKWRVIFITPHPFPRVVVCPKKIFEKDFVIVTRFWSFHGVTVGPLSWPNLAQISLSYANLRWSGWSGSENSTVVCVSRG